jgi:hypothetical protein
MSCRAGITTDPERRKIEWQHAYPNMQNWEQKRFPSRAAAQAWEELQVFCERHRGGAEPEKPGAVWWGYRFEF